MEFLRRNPMIAALAALCVVFATIVAIELAALGQTSPPPAPRKVAAAEAKLLPPIAPTAPESAYPETAARPLWIPTRRQAPPAVAAQQQTFVRGQFVLQGVAIAGNTRIAMLKEKSSGRVHRVEAGREVNGLQLAEVEPERVVLVQGGEREVVDLRVQRPPGTPQQAAGAPGAVPVPQAARPPQSAAELATMPVPAGRSGPFVPPPVQPSAGGPPLIPPGPMPPSARPPQPANPVAANPAGGQVPQQAATPMTPEELLARRRARRNQPTQ